MYATSIEDIQYFKLWKLFYSRIYTGSRVDLEYTTLSSSSHPLLVQL